MSIPLAWVATQGMAQVSWKYQELSVPPGTLEVTVSGIDKSRNAFGFIRTGAAPSAVRPVRWRAGNAYNYELSDEGGAILAVNRDGTAVGYRGIFASMWPTIGSPFDLEYMPEHSSAMAMAINPAKTIAGTLITKDQTAHRAFRYKNDDGLQLPVPDDLRHSFAQGINDAGLIVGYARDAMENPAVSYAWIWSERGGVQKLPKAGAICTAHDINNTGQIIGTARYTGKIKPIVWPFFGAPVRMAELPGYENARPVALNDGGMIVGSAWKGSHREVREERAVAWIGDTILDLNTQVNHGFYTLMTRATAINERGDIGGSALSSNKPKGFILLLRSG